MSHYGDFMDGVPVKISEKYKRPPRFELPYSVLEFPKRAQNLVDNVDYCSTYETNVLSKLKELRNAKETRKNERRHRLHLLKEAKQKQLDLVAAAEAEEKLKQLSVSEVSYPSTEEISEMSPDDKSLAECDTTVTEDSNINNSQINNHDDQNYLPNPEPSPSILQPIQIRSNCQQNNLLDDIDPLQELKMNSKMGNLQHLIPAYSKHNIDKMTFSDFENDTSSPFDNVELKTINDMELLAQVLQNQRESSTSCNPNDQYIPDQYNLANSGTQATGISYLPNYVDQPIGTMYPNGYYVSESICDNIPIDNSNQYYQYYIPTQYEPTQHPSFYSNIPEKTNENVYPYYYYSQYTPDPQLLDQPTTSYKNDVSTNTPNIITVQSEIIKSRSRSVPDIVKELDAELIINKLRLKERSCNASPTLKDVKEVPSRVEKKVRERLDEYEKLNSNLQSMCQKIHGMGFPLNRVARIAGIVGDNDKKIIEGLLILGDLMDLGFPEEKVANALKKHEFNRDKALDELVS